jgi:uncharacterized protein YdcH (DUF465 family)
LVNRGGYFDWFIFHFSAKLEVAKSNRRNLELFMKASKKLKKLKEEHNYLKTKIDQLEELRDQDRSSNTWQIIRTLKKEKLLYKDKINKENQTEIPR